MQLCLHGERWKAHKEQVKDVSISNVRKHKEGEGEERTRASSVRTHEELTSPIRMLSTDLDH